MTFIHSCIFFAIGQVTITESYKSLPFFFRCLFFFLLVWLLFELSQINFLKSITNHKQTDVGSSNESSARGSQIILVIPKVR